MDWNQLRSAWSASEHAIWERAQRWWTDEVSTRTEAYTTKVHAFAQALEAARTDIGAMSALYEAHPAQAQQREMARFNALVSRYRWLASGFYAETTGPLDAPEVGAVPLMMLGALGISAAGVAWAVAAYQYAVHLREQTAVSRQELEARIAASEEGRTLQPSTLPAPIPPSKVGYAPAIAGTVVFLGLLAGAAYWTSRGEPS